MTKYDKEIEQVALKNEKEILKQLENTYTQALADIKKRVTDLINRDEELTRSAIYQIDYQNQLEKQINAIIELLKQDNITNINSYLSKTYEDGFIGTLYNFSKQGVNMVVPLDQRQILKVIEKPVEEMTFAQRIGVNMNDFKQKVKDEVSRGLSTNRTYAEIGQMLSIKTEESLNKSYRIARTEGHRVQNESKIDSMTEAKKRGADIVKQWDSTLDSHTRKSHQQLDGEIKELEEEFSNGLMYPGDPNGDASEVCNCRCAMLQRARWAVNIPLSKLDNANPFKEDGSINLIDGKDYEEYKQNYFSYLNNQEKDDKINISNLLDRLNINIDDYNPLKQNNIQEQASQLLKMNELPTIVNSDEYNDIKGNEIVRYLRDYENETAEQAYNNTLYGKVQYSNIQNSQYGRGIYFGTKANEEELLYTYGKGNGKAINAKISNNANILEFNSMLSYIKDVSERIKELPEGLQKVYEKERSLLYMVDGYDGIKIKGKDYYCIYNRKVLIINDGK